MDKKQIKIIEKLEADGWKVISASMLGRKEIVARKAFAEISITTEECGCHGGRLWINENHTNQHFELAHETYDEGLGIVDSSTELDFIIEHEMMKKVNLFSTVVYKLTKINEFGTTSGINEEKHTYYAEMLYVASAVFGPTCKDIFATDKFTKIFPNENIIEEVTKIHKVAEYSWEKGRIWFKATRLEREDKSSEFVVKKSYEMFVSIFNKQ